MKIKITVDEKLTEIEVEIKTPIMSEAVTKITDKLSTNLGKTIRVYTGEDSLACVDVASVFIYRVYSAVGKVYVATKNCEYISKQRIYELEEILSDENFIRISNSEIINLSKVKSFDLSFPKTIAITMENDAITYVSRRYVSTIKPYLIPREKAEDYPLVISSIGVFIDVIIFDDDLVETFQELGFTHYESDFPLWKQKQYSKRLEEFSSDIAEKWVSYFISLGGVFASGREGCPRDLLLTGASKGVIRTKEFFSVGFLADGKYSITREKTAKALGEYD